MAYIQGEGRSQGTLFPIVVDDLISSDHICRVVDAFVTSLCMVELGFERSQAAETEFRNGLVTAACAASRAKVMQQMSETQTLRPA
jgi:transposase